MAYYDSHRHRWIQGNPAQRGRSGFESREMDRLDSLNINYLYEMVRLPYAAPAVYVPDFLLPEQAIVLELKGQFNSSDRQKMLRVKAQYPDLDIRLVFSNANTRIGKTSQTTYGMWAERNGFPYASHAIPVEWFDHKPTAKQRKAFKEISPK